jgi:predicted AAA+ superfamily ATPase
MRLVARNLSGLLLDAARHYPAVVVTGPRRSGKTTLLRGAFPGSQYVLLEDPDVQARIRSDPRSFLEGLRPPVVFDEIQNTPELFDYVRTLIDTSPRRMGQWLFTGSQEAPLMKGITESMAGRAAVLQLLPFSLAETPKVSLIYGGFPEVLSRPRSRELWFASYLQTYLERDVRSVTGVRDLATFRRFLALIASRHGQILNRTDLSAPLGVSVPTISEWLHVLEVTGQIILVPPYFENFGKRLIKSPKLYIGDSGLACFLLGLRRNRIVYPGDAA